jgi:phosphoglycolate phosphatase
VTAGSPVEAARPAVRLCVFDCDGTLVDSQHGIVTAMADAFAASGLAPPSGQAVLSVVGLSLRDAVAALLTNGQSGLVEPIAARYALSFADLRRRSGHREPLYPGVREALDLLEARGWSLALATGKSHRGALSTLDAHGLRARFRSIQTVDSASGKPAPGMLLNAMADVGADAAATVMIGDSSYDMVMARNAGVTGVGVGWGYQRESELRAAGAAVVVRTAEALPDLLDRLVAGR